MATVYKVLVIVGLLSLIHAAYSAAQHRSYLRLTEQEFTQLPLDIIVQSVIGLIATMYGVLYVAGDFKEIRATVELENKSFETYGNRPSFYIFNHRGRVLSPNYIQ
ncbi:ER membrane protein complex subunit 5 [Centruroides vittatus]|uniref:membrane magnesium transporter 1-like n=1 Tax=Centruroides sculpturatus TaxID=218467 RepID=UPI000C6DC552|nr:membrane magnesium transporter 1-like [Centruroides sculpturatus]